MKEIGSPTSDQIMHKLPSAISEMQMVKTNDYWLSPAGQEELQNMSEYQSRKGISIFDYAPSTEASLCPMTAPDDKWYEGELTADKGACDTVVPKLMCPGILITPSVQSLRGNEYEVATGGSIPNLGGEAM